MKKKILSILMVILLTFTNISSATYYVNTHSLNVRSGEGLRKSSIISVIHKGESVELIEDYKYGWKKIRMKDGTEGYVNGKYLDNSAPTIKFVNTNGQNWEKVKVNVYSAFIRLDTQKKPIAVARMNEELEVIGEYYPKNGRVKVKVIDPNSKYYNREGHIAKHLVEPISFNNNGSQYNSTSNLDNLFKASPKDINTNKSVNTNKSNTVAKDDIFRSSDDNEQPTVEVKYFIDEDDDLETIAKQVSEEDELEYFLTQDGKELEDELGLDNSGEIDLEALFSDL